MYAAQHRCMTSKIDVFRMKLIYFKTCIITHNNSVIEQNINVSMFDILSVKEPHTTSKDGETEARERLRKLDTNRVP